MEVHENKNEVKGPGVMLCLRDTSTMATQLQGMAKDLATNAIEQRRLSLAAIELLLASGDVLCTDTVGQLEDIKGILEKEVTEDEQPDGNGNGDGLSEETDAAVEEELTPGKAAGFLVGAAAQVAKADKEAAETFEKALRECWLPGLCEHLFGLRPTMQAVLLRRYVETVLPERIEEERQEDSRDEAQGDFIDQMSKLSFAKQTELYKSLAAAQSRCNEPVAVS